MVQIPWSTPPTFTAGNVVTEAQMDIVSDDLTFLANPPTCRIYNSANISHTTSGTQQALTFNSERYDTDTMHSTAVNTGRITFTTAGKYAVWANIEFASNATGWRAVEFRVNGTTFIASIVHQANATQVTRVNLYTEYAFAATDYVEIIANQTSGGALNITAAGNYSPEAGARWVSL